MGVAHCRCRLIPGSRAVACSRQLRHLDVHQDQVWRLALVTASTAWQPSSSPPAREARACRAIPSMTLVGEGCPRRPGTRPLSFPTVMAGEAASAVPPTTAVCAREISPARIRNRSARPCPAILCSTPRRRPSGGQVNDDGQAQPVPPNSRVAELSAWEN